MLKLPLGSCVNIPDSILSCKEAKAHKQAAGLKSINKREAFVILGEDCKTKQKWSHCFLWKHRTSFDKAGVVVLK